MKCNNCGHQREGEKEQYTYCPMCGSKSIEFYDESKIEEEIKLKLEAQLKEKILSEVTSLFSNKKFFSLLSKGWEITQQPALKTIKGVKFVSKDVVLQDKKMIAVIGDGKLDTAGKLAEYPLEYVDIAKKLGAETIIVMDKDYPCICRLPDEKFIVIAPRVKDD